MKKYRVFYIQYQKYVCFTVNDKQYIRRLYNNVLPDTYYIRFKNEYITIFEDDLFY